jgi:hypothetical protein
MNFQLPVMVLACTRTTTPADGWPERFREWLTTMAFEKVPRACLENLPFLQ